MTAGASPSSEHRIAVYLEVGRRRTFAGALEWPGWSRSGRDEDAALQSLADYGRRYASVVGSIAPFSPPAGASHLEVVERLEGSATTDFGAPDAVPRADERPLDEPELTRQRQLLQACWRAFDSAMEATASVELRKGPRGGGRDHQRIAEHVLGAERSYLAALGARQPEGDGGDPQRAMTDLREAVLAALAARARGEPIPNASGTRKLWTPRYFVRRAAWHVLDHAWEIEDRAAPAASLHA